jgi:hypothetical protein
MCRAVVVFFYSYCTPRLYLYRCFSCVYAYLYACLVNSHCRTTTQPPATGFSPRMHTRRQLSLRMLLRLSQSLSQCLSICLSLCLRLRLSLSMKKRLRGNQGIEPNSMQATPKSRERPENERIKRIRRMLQSSMQRIRLRLQSSKKIMFMRSISLRSQSIRLMLENSNVPKKQPSCWPLEGKWPWEGCPLR